MRKHLTYTNITVTLALVFAMTGGAYAASKYVINTTKQINPKVLKSLVGKTGANGTQGPAGPAGPQGPAGTTGAKGETGAAGQNGTPGEKGAQGEKGLAGTNGFNGSNGAKGPAGPIGPIGPTGSPWTAGGTLPTGSTETGQWSFAFKQATEGNQAVTANMSFPIALANAPSAEHTHLIGAEEGEGEPHENLPEENSKKLCSGNHKEPHAANGNLCIFIHAVDAFTIEEGVPKIVALQAPFTIIDAETGEAHAGRTGAYLFTLSLSHYVENTPTREATKTGDTLTGNGDWAATG